MGGFQQGFAQGTGVAAQTAQRKETLDLLQRQFLAKQYEQYANNIALPNQQADPEGYKKALDMRTQALEAAQKVYAPDHHATLGEHLHGLIFGQKQAPPPQASSVPVSASAPVVPGSAGAAVPPQPAAQNAPASDHPFASNPAYAKILEGLNGLGNRLKAAVHPNPPPAPLPSLGTFASAPTQEDLAREAAATGAENAQQLEKMRAASAAEVARIRADASGASTPEKAHLTAYTKKHFGTSYAESDPDQQVEAVADWKKANQPPVHMQFKVIEGKLYGVNPVDGSKKFIANDSDVRVTQGTRFVTNTVTGEVQAVPYTTVTSKATGKQLADSDSGVAAPVSSQAPSLAAVNQKIQTGNAASKKLNKGKPQPKSSQAPQPPGARVVAHTASLVNKSDAAQYTKVAEDANAKHEAYVSAQKALSGTPTASSDQELLYSWVRANVQGAGRMTQAEFNQAASVGSLPLRAQAAWEKLKTGRLPPEQEQMFLADIKRAAETSAAEAANLRKRLQGGPESVPAPDTTKSGKGFDWNSLPSAPQ